MTVGVPKRDWCRSEFYGLWMFMVEISNWFSWDESNFRTGKAPPRMFIRFVKNHEPWWKKNDSTSKIKDFIYLENHNRIFFGQTTLTVLIVITALIVWSHMCERCYSFYGRVQKKCRKNTGLLRVGLQCFLCLTILMPHVLSFMAKYCNYSG